MTKRRFTILITSILISNLSFRIPAQNKIIKKISSTSKASIKIKQPDKENSTWGFTTASEIDLKGFSAKIAWQTDTTTFGSEINFHQPAWAFACNLNDLTVLPLTLKIGQISPGGSLSRLNSPALYSSTYPFASFSSASTALTTTFPTSSGYQKPIAGALIFDQKNQKSILRRVYISSFYDAEERFIFSSSLSLNIKKSLDLSFSYTAGRFFYGNSSSSWFNKKPLFNENWFLNQNIQGAISGRYFSTKFTANLYQSVVQPLEKTEYTLCSENSFHSRYFKFIFAGFHASSPYIFTSSGTQLSTLNQIKCSPQFTFFLPKNLARIKTGINSFAEEKLQTDGTTHVSAKFSAGTECRTKRTNSKLQFSISGMEVGEDFQKICTEGIYKTREEVFEPATYNLSYNFYLVSKIQPNFSCSYSILPENQKQTYKCGLNFALPVKHNIFCKTSFSLTTEEDSAKSSNLEMAFTYKYKQKKLQISAAFCINYVFI